MSDHANATRMREGYDAYAKGDLAALTELMREDIRWHEPGDGPLSGDHEGPQAVFAMFARSMELTENSLRVEPVQVCADDEHGVALVRFLAHRGDRHLDTLVAQVFRFGGDGRVAEFWNAPTQPQVMEDFLR
ncbi:nuclear transport factor 2 family protein [Geodermatophilus sp. SYSU D01036]